MSTVPAGAAAHPRRPWGLACLLLALAGAFFFSSYGFANWLASQRALLDPAPEAKPWR